VKNADLWRRIDQALSYHTLVCRTWRTDEATGNADSETEAVAAAGNYVGDDFASEDESQSRRWPQVRNRLRRALQACRPRWAMAAVTAQ
jgi:hypothetical protein